MTPDIIIYVFKSISNKTTHFIEMVLGKGLGAHPTLQCTAKSIQSKIDFHIAETGSHHHFINFMPPYSVRISDDGKTLYRYESLSDEEQTTLLYYLSNPEQS